MLNALPGPSLRSEFPAGSDHHIARVAVVGRGVEADVGVVHLVEQVVDVEGRRQVFRELVTGHQAHQPVRILGEFFGASLAAVVERLPARALPARAAAEGKFVQAALELVAGVEAGPVFRLPGRDLFVLGIAGNLVGVARLQLPAGVEFAGDLRLIAFGLGAHIGAVVARNRVEQRVG